MVEFLHHHPVEILEMVWKAAHRFRHHMKCHGNSISAVQVTLSRANAHNFKWKYQMSFLITSCVLFKWPYFESCEGNDLKPYPPRAWKPLNVVLPWNLVPAFPRMCLKCHQVGHKMKCSLIFKYSLFNKKICSTFSFRKSFRVYTNNTQVIPFIYIHISSRAVHTHMMSTNAQKIRE